MPPPASGPPSDAAIDAMAVLNRAWAIERLMRNVQVAMGELPAIVQRAVIAGDGEAISFERIEICERNGAAANQGLAMLLKELDTIDPARPRAKAAAPLEKTPQRLAFEAAMDKWAEEGRQMAAKPRAGSDGNGHANPKGSAGGK